MKVIKAYQLSYLVGDLAFHIKRRRAKTEYLDETEIMNWFV